MTTEKGICPKTGKACAARFALEESIESLDTFLRMTRVMTEDIPFPKFARFLAQMIKGADFMDKADAELIELQEEKALQEGYLILNCVGEKCIVKEAAERDDFDLDLITEGERE